MTSVKQAERELAEAEAADPIAVARRKLDAALAEVRARNAAEAAEHRQRELARFEARCDEYVEAQTDALNGVVVAAAAARRAKDLRQELKATARELGAGAAVPPDLAIRLRRSKPSWREIKFELERHTHGEV